MPFAGHYLLNVVNIILLLKGQKTVLRHKEVNRNRLINQARSRIGIVGGDHNDHTVMLRKVPNGRRNIGSLTDNDAVRSVVESRQLALRTISQNHDIMRFYVIIHHFRIGCRNHNLSLFTKALYVTGNPSSLQRFQNILKLRLRCRNNGGIIDIHIGLCNIGNGNQALQYPLFRHSGKSHYMAVPHNLISLL